ncbi:hypothetical protein AB0M48_32310 [Lentzea sp. NPDC051208]|uniref:hypothetical protein n=1 Tax=Lentzea sp. NPDC051208 TaxID=3154642 RepID=UPI0034132034
MRLDIAEADSLGLGADLDHRDGTLVHETQDRSCGATSGTTGGKTRQSPGDARGRTPAKVALSVSFGHSM